MTGLNSQYMLAPSLQEYFVDKTTGLPLANGTVTFYKDNSRSSFKPVYELVDGGSENYSYSALDNPLTLSAVGTIQDETGNDILPYYFPYDSNGNVELYYVVVKDSLGVVQFTRSAWPNLVSATSTTDNVENFVPNGQFLQHNTIFTSTSSVSGAITADTTAIAPGGWYFERSAGATDSDFVNFTRFNNYTATPDQSPRYAVTVSCTSATNATSKYLSIRFNDVNKFSSDIQTYTFAFFAKSAGADSVQILTKKYFGTGGSPSSTVITNVGSLNLTTGYPSTAYVFSFAFGANTAYVIGTNNDDYVEVIVSFPTGVSFNSVFTDFALVLNTQTSVNFPVTTNSKFNYQSLLQSITPNYTNLKYYLPIIMTSTGFDFDTGAIGKISARMSNAAIVGELLCDGTTYTYNKVSTDLIPYSRLGDALWVNASNAYVSGSGSDFVTAIPSTGNTGKLLLFANQAGTTGSVANPASSTFTVQTTFSAKSSALAVNSAFYTAATSFIVRGTVAGSVTAPAANTSGFTVTEGRNNAAAKHAFTVLAANSALGGKYFTFSTTTTNYYVWFQVDGVGVDPAPGGTGILVNTSATDSITDVSTKVIGVLNSGWGASITLPAANSITSGTYFTFGTITTAYYVWFKKDGSGSDPAPGGTGIEVDITTGQTAAQVVTAAQAAINKFCYAVPNLQGVSLRGVDSGTVYDALSASRTNPLINNVYMGNNLPGSLEFDGVASHTHTATSVVTQTTLANLLSQTTGGAGTANAWLRGSSTDSNRDVSTQAVYTVATTLNSGNTPAGQAENTIFNIGVYYFIKY